MSLLRTGLYVFFALALLDNLASQVEMKKLRGNKRNYIIKCCGRKSCINVSHKKANHTLIKQPTVSLTSRFKTLPLGVSRAETAGGNTEIMENAKTDAAAAPESTANVNLDPQIDAKSQAPAEITVFPTDLMNGGGTPSSEAEITAVDATPPTSPIGIPKSGSTKYASTTTTSTNTLSPSKVLTSPSLTDTALTQTIFLAQTSSTSTVTSTGTTLTSNVLSGGSTLMSPSTTSTISTKSAPTTTTLPYLYNCSDLTCARNASLFDASANLIDAQKYGAWREICGELYLFGKSIVTWETNVKRCCSIGMKPVAFETLEKFNCFKNITQFEVWPYNFNYWTSARQIFSNNTFQWCLYSTPGTFTNATPMWAIGNPNNLSSVNCVHLSIPKNKNTTQLAQKSCSNTFILSCKGQPTPAPPCFTPTCPTGKCSKNDSLYSLARDKVSKFLANPSQYGSWKSMNYRIFMFGNASKTWAEAFATCCAIGMKLLSVDMDYKYSVLSLALGNDQGTLSGKYWTSGTDNGCPGAFGWCAANKLVRGPIWARGEPQSGKNCIAVDVRSTNTTLSSADCTAYLPFICEARDTSNSTSGGKAIKEECASNYNITDVEQENIFNSTKFDVKIKCFLKCLGESGGIMLNGRVVDEQLIKLAETLSPNNNDQLMSDLKAVDECSGLKGMDECDTAALAYQCGQEKAPNLVANAIKVVELNNTAEKSPLQPALGECATDYDCAVVPYYRNIFLSNGSSDGMLIDICGKRYLLGNQVASYREAATWCCKYGLNIISLETVEEFNCIVASSLGGQARPMKTWTSATRKGTANNGFRWCTSKAAFDLSMWTVNNIDAYPENHILTMYIQTPPTSTYFNTDDDTQKSSFPFCEEQPL
ncbi:uncharacterized protein LOC135939425 [Cloeon dipterum]|uniref:uncharacterized protein LOC135939425 n=1 Tax=Cloeon dipterum TaxID=197152 RepID=UPI00321F62F5